MNSESMLPPYQGKTASLLSSDPIRREFAALIGADPAKVEVALKIDVIAPLPDGRRLPLQGQFTLTEQGTLAVTAIWYDLGVPGEGAWVFSRLFTDLPPFDPSWPEGGALLDLFRFSRAKLVFAGPAGCTVDGQKVSEGAWVVGTLADLALLRKQGFLPPNIGFDREVGLKARIVMPDQAETVIPCDRIPWHGAAERVPGIDLRLDLGWSFDHDVLNFSEFAFHLYTPHSREWQAKNPSYEPMLGLGGHLTILREAAREAGAKELDVWLSGVFSPGQAGITIFADLENATLGNMARIAKLVQVVEQVDAIPGFGKFLDFSLQRITVGLMLNDVVPSVETVSVKIGFKTGWELPLIGIGVQNLYGTFTLGKWGNPGWSTSAVVGGEIVIDKSILDMRYELSSRSLFAELRADMPLRVEELLKKINLGFSIPTDFHLPIDHLEIEIRDFKEYYISALLLDSNACTIDIGDAKLAVSNLELEIEKLDGADTALSVRGVVDFNESVSLDLSYRSPGNVCVRGTFREFSLQSLLQKLLPDFARTLGGFDLAFKESWIQIEKAGDGYGLQAFVDVEGAVSAGFALRRKGGQWGAALGLSTGTTLKDFLAKHRVLKPLEEFADCIGLEGFTLILSSVAEAEFEFPAAAKFTNAFPGFTGQDLALQPSAGGAAGLRTSVVKGLNLLIDLDLGKNREAKALAEWLGYPVNNGMTLRGQFSISLPRPSDESRFWIAVAPREAPKQIAGGSFDGKFGIALKSGNFGVFAEGKFHFSVDGRAASVSVVAKVVPNGVLVGGSYTGPALKFSFGGGVVQLNDLALAVGIDFEGIPSVGLAGTADFCGHGASVAVMIDSTNPMQSILVGSVSDITIGAIVKALKIPGLPADTLPELVRDVGLSSIDAFPITDADIDVKTILDKHDLAKLNEAFRKSSEKAPDGSVSLATEVSRVLISNGHQEENGDMRWHVSDLEAKRHYTIVKKAAGGYMVKYRPQIYIVPQSSDIAGLSFKQGICVKGMITHFLYKLYVNAEISMDSGVSILARFPKPITLLHERVFCVSAAVEAADINAAPATGEAGGTGPELSVCTYKRPNQLIERYREPHVLLTGQVSILGLVVSRIYISIAANQVLFDFTSRQILAGVNFHVDIKRIDDATVDLKIGGSLEFGFRRKVPLEVLGIANIDTLAVGRVDIAHRTGGSLAATLGAKLALLGREIEIAAVTLTVSSDLMDAAGLILDEVKAATIGSLKDVGRWIAMIDEGFIEPISRAAGELARVMRDYFAEQDDKRVVALLRVVQCDAIAIAEAMTAVYQSSPAALAGALAAAAVTPPEIAEALFKGAKAPAPQVAEALKATAPALSSADIEAALAKGGVPSDQAQAAARAALPDYRPTEVRAVVMNRKLVTITWTAARSPVVRYTVEAVPHNGGAAIKGHTIASTTYSFAVDRLQTNVTYDVTVSGIAADGTQHPAASVTLTWRPQWMPQWQKIDAPVVRPETGPTDIVDVTGRGRASVVVLLRRDGSVWQWEQDDTISQVSGFAKDAPIVAIAGNGESLHCLAVDRHGDVWHWDKSTPERLSHGFRARVFDKPIPTRSIVAGEYFSAVIADDGKVWVADHRPKWEGDHRLKRFEPMRGLGDRKASMLAGGRYHLLVLTEDGKVFGAGANDCGALGQKDGTRFDGGRDIDRAVEIDGLRNIDTIVAGAYHNFARSEGRWWGWGLHDRLNLQTGYGSFGSVEQLAHLKPVMYQSEHYRILPPSLLEHMDGVSWIAPELYHTFVGDTQGNVSVWGQAIGKVVPIISEHDVRSMFVSTGPNVALTGNGQILLIDREANGSWQRIGEWDGRGKPVICTEVVKRVTTARAAVD